MQTQKPLPEAPGFGKEDLRRILVNFNDTHVAYPQDMCLHQLFEKQVIRTPARIALAFEGKQLTYSELNMRANQLAHYLQRHGVEPDSLVGVFMERSLEMVIALYGILKAGAAYVPLDPEYPPERLAYMIEDTQVPVLLAQKHLMESLHDVTDLAKLHGHEELNKPIPSIQNPTVICLDMDWDTIAGESTENPSSGATASNLAYVIYTSGSTGRPKGVMNEHQGICNRLFWMQDEYGLTGSDRVLQKTPFSFDVSVWEFFWPLLFGARLVIASPGGHKDSSYLLNIIREQEISTLHFVPSMLQVFLDDRDVKTCSSIKRVICSGEALSYELQERFFGLLDAELHNLYGPTEAAVDVTYWPCQQGSDLGFVPIGYPVANTQIYILDHDMHPVPIGEPGELHIGGVQVARGYLNRPELTAEKFIPDPFTNKPQRRLYKTGDVACYLADGAIKYMGRMDHQVKIRGIRIELGEIESAIESYAGIKQAVVLAREDRPGDKYLVAYLVGEDGREVSNTKLREYLLGKLPDAMIPSYYVKLDFFPLLPNGKVDRRILPEPSHERPDLDQPYVSPRNELESHLVEIWCDILNLDRVGIYDRFFELGGTSLQAARFINRLQEQLAENIYIVSIFDKPTISEYAEFLQTDYGEAIDKKLQIRVKTLVTHETSSEEGKIDEKAVGQMQECIFYLNERRSDAVPESKNPPAMFILAPPRSGTTLLRVMLAGHPDLFAAAELQLLGFNTLRERKDAFSGKFSLWLEGTIRAIMETKQCDADEAYQIMSEYERQDCTTKEFYRALQDWIGEKILVDKSPAYVMDLATLQKAEQDFDNALYIHLVRHPYSTVRSFERYHMDQVLFVKDHPFTPRQLGELVWLISHRNASTFLQKIPGHRKYFMRFEDLVREPKRVMEQLCKTLRLKFHADLIRPYKNIDKKMTDGIYKDSKPMGDTKLLDHKDIDSKVAESWKGVLADNFLSKITWQLARSLGYESPPKAGEALLSKEAHTIREMTASGRRKRIEQSRRLRQQLRNSRR